MSAALRFESTHDLLTPVDSGQDFGGLAPGEIVIDCFAGGGGASTGIEWAIGRSPDEAINHSATAIAIHKANHPTTHHWHSDVWEVDPLEVAAGRPVGLAWFSPDCTHFSRAKGGKPVSKKIRMLAHTIVWYAAKVRPRIIMGENVEEFQTWGPVSRETNNPNPKKKGHSFRAWVRQLVRLGYRVEWRMLRGCDFGAPTTRHRLFFIARCDGQAIRWPLPRRGKGTGVPYRTAAECIDFSLPCPSIFLTKEEAKAQGLKVKRPIVANTLRRVARGVDRFVINTAEPFVIAIDHQSSTGSVWPITSPLSTVTTEPRHALVAPTLIQVGYGERKGQAPRVLDIRQPLGTIVAGGAKHALVGAFLAKHYGDTGQRPGSALSEPIDTITENDHHSLVYAFLVAYFGNEKDGGSLRNPMRTVTGKDRFALVTVHGVDYAIVDIGMRMLTARELANAQGMPPGFILAAPIEVTAKSGRRRWTTVNETAQKKMIGNSVNPDVSRDLVLVNVGAPVARERAA
jgi:DNA (cytosine-5)-methyltransferase 1